MTITMNDTPIYLIITGMLLLSPLQHSTFVHHADAASTSSIRGAVGVVDSNAIDQQQNQHRHQQNRQLNLFSCAGNKSNACKQLSGCTWYKGDCIDVSPTTASPTTSPTTVSPTASPTKAQTEPPVLTASPTTSPTKAQTEPPTNEPPALTCSSEHCGNDIVNTAVIVDSATLCPDLVAVTIATFEYDNDGDGTSDVLIELTGPASMTDAADLVITSPHGGDSKPAYIPTRTADGPFCPSSGCKTIKDSYTLQIAELLQSKFISNYCKVPFLVKNHLHRSKLDANREVGEAAHGNIIAEDAWQQFHNLTNYAQVQLEARFGSAEVTKPDASTVTGAKALLFDMHGYTGYDWTPTDGSPFIQWGYRLSDHTSLNPDVYCPLDTRSEGTIGTMSHARWMPNHSYECLVRGPGSLGSRVSSLVDSRNGLDTSIGNAAMCGRGMPSFEYESPWHAANDPVHCDKVATNGGGSECHYYNGGYDVEVHERMDWENVAGDHFNTVQAELPRCIRFGGTVVREEFADVLSVAVMSFLRDLFV